MPWRNTRDPYRILVSEVMLQQTQVDRVLPKYKSWLKIFPSWKALASAELRDVLAEWKGLGYNRRALALKRAAEKVVGEYRGKFPRDYTKVLSLPGVGPYTAGAVMTFAFDEPYPVIETNIRTVFIHHFFNTKRAMVRKEVSRDLPLAQRSVTPTDATVSDKHLLHLIEKTLDEENPREWYYALMDYGAFLKKSVGNVSRRSSHYAKQSPFKGSNRELRAKVLHALTETPWTAAKLAQNLGEETVKVRQVLVSLGREGFIAKAGSTYRVR